MTYEHSLVLCGVPFGASRPVGGLSFSELTDWDGKPDARGNNDPIPGGHGSYGRVDVLRGSRAISVEGAVIADSLTEYHEIRRRLEALPDVGTMTVDTGDGPWSREVEIQHVKVDDHHGDTATGFVIDMVAPDPVRYRDAVVLGPVGLPVREGGLVLPAAFPWDFGSWVREELLVENSGSVPLHPTVTVEGSASSVTVSGGPFRLEFGAFSGRLVFDCLARRAWLDGSDVTRRLVRRDWPVVGAGESAQFSFDAVSASPDLVMSVEYRIGVW